MQTAQRLSQVASPIGTPSAVDGTHLAPHLYQLLVNHFSFHFGLWVVSEVGLSLWCYFCISLMTREVGHFLIC